MTLADDIPTVIYGAGEEGAKLAVRLKDAGAPAHFFCDQDEQKRGTMLENISVLSPTDLVNMRQDCRIVLAIYSQKFPIEEVFEFIKKTILLPLQRAQARVEVFQISDFKTVFSSYAHFCNAAHWTDPLVYSMAEPFTHEYAVEMRTLPFQEILKNGVLTARDVSGRYLNIQDGIRKTVGAQEHFENSIYLVEDSRAMSSGVWVHSFSHPQSRKTYHPV